MTTAPHPTQTIDDSAFNELQAAMTERMEFLVKENESFVVADIDAKRVFMEALPEGSVRQHYNCSACKKFLDEYGGLAIIKDDGRLESALFHYPFDGHLAPAIQAINRAMSIASVKRSPKPSCYPNRVVGRPTTYDDKRDKDWGHFHIHDPGFMRPSEARERFLMLRRGFSEFSLATFQQAHTLLTSGNLSQGKRHADMCGHFIKHIQRWSSIESKKYARNHLWHLAVSAPPGWCNFRGGALGALLEDVADNKPFATIKRRFENVMDPLKYQRQQSVSEGQLERAEAKVVELGIQNSLRRRYATMDDIQTIWAPKTPSDAAEAKEGVFGHVRTKDGPGKQETIEQPAVKTTWVKFRRDVLPTAERMEVYVPYTGNFMAFTTAADPEAPVIHQWGNPVAYYVYYRGSSAHNWGLTRNEYVDATGVVLPPHQWEDEEAYQQLGTNVCFLLKGCADQNTGQGLGLFPSHLKSELHEIRAAVEAYSKQTEFEPCPGTPTAGLAFTVESPVKVRVNGGLVYHIDRME